MAKDCRIANILEAYREASDSFPVPIIEAQEIDCRVCGDARNCPRFPFRRIQPDGIHIIPVEGSNEPIRIKVEGRGKVVIGRSTQETRRFFGGS